jgi:tetratricopeptide (TPR) repeat protein
MFGLVDWSFIITLGVIVLTTLIGAWLRARHRDRCLTDFDGYHITVERKNNRVMWGDMRLQPTGFELVYRSDVQDEGHMETSYVYYKDEYGEIQAIYRYARDLTPELQARRARSVEKSLHPGVLRRARRSLRNFLSTAADSFAEALTMTLGRVRRKGAALMTDTSQSYLRGISKDVIGYVGTSFDPLLEKFVGTRVVVEVVEDEEVHEHVGMLKEYSADFLEVLDVYYPLPQEVKLSGKTDYQIADKVTITLEDRQLRIHNLADQPQYLERIEVGEQSTELNAILTGGEEIIVQIAAEGQEIALHMRIASRLDMVVPRAHALIRHRAERYNPDSIFDVGLALVRRENEERDIERLRQALRYAPQDAISAAKLGELLLHNGEFREARHWLLEAQERCYRLPDRGNRVAQNLRQLERHMEQLRMHNRMAEELRIISVSSTGPAEAVEHALDI